MLDLVREYGISARLTFSNSLLREEHLSDKKCNALCALLEQENPVQSGVIVHSELLLDYLKTHYPQLYFVSSTTKVLTEFQQLRAETAREEFRYVVPDFRLNKAFGELDSLPQAQKDKVEFLCNECCWVGCRDDTGQNAKSGYRKGVGGSIKQGLLYNTVQQPFAVISGSSACSKTSQPAR